MGEALIEALQLIEEGMQTGNRLAQKQVAFAEAKVNARLKARAKKTRATLSFTGDNWLWPTGELGQFAESAYPDLSASVAFTARSRYGRIIATAMAPVSDWNQQIVIADGEGAWIGNAEDCDFELIDGVDGSLLQQPPRVYVFGQKSSPHWVAMNSVIGDMNKDGVKTANDCGPYYGLTSWLSDCVEGVIAPRNVAYCEPYANKPKEELMAFVVRCLNRNLPRSDRFLMTDMAGQTLFDGKRMKRAGTDEKYAASGYIIAPTAKAHEKALTAMRKSVINRHEFVTAEAGSKMRLLAEELARGFPEPDLLVGDPHKGPKVEASTPSKQ